MTRGEICSLEFALDNLDFSKVASANNLNPYTVLTVWEPLKKLRDKFKTTTTLTISMDISTASALFIVLLSDVKTENMRVHLEIEKYIINTYQSLEQSLIKIKS